MDKDAANRAPERAPLQNNDIANDVPNGGSDAETVELRNVTNRNSNRNSRNSDVISRSSSNLRESAENLQSRNRFEGRDPNIGNRLENQDREKESFIMRKTRSLTRSMRSSPSDTKVTMDNEKPMIACIEETSPEDAAFGEGTNVKKAAIFELEPYDPESQDNCTKAVDRIRTRVSVFWRMYGPLIKKLVLLILLILYIAYFGFAIYHSPTGALTIIVITALICAYLLWSLIWRLQGECIYSWTCGPIASIFEKPWWKYCRWAIYGCIALAMILFLILDVGADSMRMRSAGGMLVFISIGFFTSTNPARVKWRPVLWGLGLQFLLGVMILRWESGYHFFRFLGDQVKVFLDFTDEGSKFVFGEEGYLMHRMAFKVFPIVIYFSAVISILYYWGCVQFVVCKIAKVMQYTMGTTAIESLNAAANIFIGMAESCVIMRPFIHKLTKSELHAVMTGGFATVAGSYIALLVEVGASPEHLLSAAIMSAPAALAMAKLSYPETEISHTRTEEDVYMEKTLARNVVEAASNGAIAAIKVVASVAANLIAIMGLIAFLDALLSYLGARVGFPEFKFTFICSYVFWPLAAVMGVDMADAFKVARLLGTKVIVDEFLSFRDLGIMIENNDITDRSTVIATYACCGFGSISAVGIYIGALVSVAPQRRGDISEVALRAVVNGNLAGFLTACIAGVLYTGDSLMFQSHQHIVAENVTQSILDATLTY